MQHFKNRLFSFQKEIRNIVDSTAEGMKRRRNEGAKESASKACFYRSVVFLGGRHVYRKTNLSVFKILAASYSTCFI